MIKNIKMVSISLKNRKISKKFPKTLLNAYSLKKYKLLYDENKTAVNSDIRSISIKYDIVVPKEIIALLYAEMLPKNEKNIYLKEHLENI